MVDGIVIQRDFRPLVHPGSFGAATTMVRMPVCSTSASPLVVVIRFGPPVQLRVFAGSKL